MFIVLKNYDLFLNLTKIWKVWLEIAHLLLLAWLQNENVDYSHVRQNVILTQWTGGSITRFDPIPVSTGRLEWCGTSTLQDSSPSHNYQNHATNCPLPLSDTIPLTSLTLQPAPSTHLSLPTPTPPSMVPLRSWMEVVLVTELDSGLHLGFMNYLINLVFIAMINLVLK